MTSQIVEEQADFIDSEIEEIRNMYPQLEGKLRTLASTLIERVGSELIGSDESLDGITDFTHIKIIQARNLFRASQRTNLQKIK